MSARIFGLAPNALVPGPDLFLTRDPEGKTTARRSFYVLKSSLASSIVQAKIKKGTKITVLCSDIPSDYQHLEVDSSESQDAPGGISVVAITFTGYTESGEFSFDRERVYSLRGVLTERPIIEHPNFIAQMADLESEKKGITLLYHDKAHVANPNDANPEIVYTQTDDTIVTITDPVALRWFNKIFIEGKRTYDAPTYEWTKATANAGGLASADISNYGKSDTPPGSPPEPTGDGWWQMVDLSDERSSNASSNSLTWRWIFGELDEDLYDY